MTKKINNLRHAQAWIQHFDDATPEQRTRLLEIALLGVAAPSGVEHIGGKARVWWNDQQWVTVSHSGDCVVNDQVTRFSDGFLENEPFKDDTFIAFPLVLDEAPEADDFSNTSWGFFFGRSSQGLTDVASARYKARVLELASAGVKVPNRSQRSFDDITVAWTNALQMICHGDGSVLLIFEKDGFFDVVRVGPEVSISSEMLSVLLGA